METYETTLKELSEKYTFDEVLYEIGSYFAIYMDSYHSLRDLYTTIQDSDGKPYDDRKLMYFVSGPIKQIDNEFVLTVGLKIGRRKYRLSNRNADIERLANTKLTIESAPTGFSFTGVPMINELQFFIIALLSLNAFDAKIVDHYFEGKTNKANAVGYLVFIRDDRLHDARFAWKETE